MMLNTYKRSAIFAAPHRHLHIVPDSAGATRVGYQKPMMKNIMMALVTTFIVVASMAPVDTANSSTANWTQASLDKQRELTRERTQAAMTAAYEQQKEEKSQRAMLVYLSGKYKSISKNVIKQVIGFTREASKKYKVPQSLILAVIGRESGYDPYLISTGNAEGLMQVIPFWHKGKRKAIGGAENIVNPRDNILKGTEVLREYLDLHGQNVVLALQQYNGSITDPRRGYSNKVLTEKKGIDEYVGRTLKSGVS